MSSWAADEKSFSLIFDENPLADFVELPEEGPYEKIWYSNVLCGVIRGALEMVLSLISVLMKVQLDVKAEFVSDVLRGHDRTEMRITFNRFIEEEVPAGDD